MLRPAYLYSLFGVLLLNLASQAPIQGRLHSRLPRSAERNEDFKLNGQYVNTPEIGVVGIPFVDEYIEKSAMDYLNNLPKGQPFFMAVTS